MDTKRICSLIEERKEELSDLSVISKYGSSLAFAYGAGRDFSKEGGAHQPNEYILCDKLVNYTKNIAAYVIRTLG